MNNILSVVTFLPLAGVLVVALEQAVAAPYCSSRLADAGARVIKVERPEGDFARGYDATVKGLSANFVWLNRSKESLTLDLKRVEAVQVLRQGLTYLNVSRSGRRRAEDAARVVDEVGGADRLLRDVARRELTLRSLRPERRLALEMAVDERAEVEELERQWREAEEIAEIADGTLSTTAQLEEELRRLKRSLGDQPSG